ncbi:MAG: hypothetical protein WD673_07390 [Alphaproteobacteria bacterium]
MGTAYLTGIPCSLRFLTASFQAYAADDLAARHGLAELGRIAPVEAGDRRLLLEQRPHLLELGVGHAEDLVRAEPDQKPGDLDVRLAVRRRDLASVGLVEQDAPGFVLLERLVDHVGAVNDRGVAPVGRHHVDAAVDDDAARRPQRGDHVGPMRQLRGVDRHGHAAVLELVDRVGARVHHVALEPGADLLERLLLAREDRELGRAAVLLGVAGHQLGDIVATPLEHGDLAARANDRRARRDADAERGRRAHHVATVDAAPSHAVDELDSIHGGMPSGLVDRSGRPPRFPT